MGYNAITHLFDHPLYMPNDFTCTKVCDCMLTNSYTHHDAPQEHLLYIPPKVYSLMVLIVLYQKLAVWNVDYLHNQGKKNSNIYVETHTQFHVYRNCHSMTTILPTTYVHSWYWWSLVSKAVVVEVIIKTKNHVETYTQFHIYGNCQNMACNYLSVRVALQAVDYQTKDSWLVSLLETTDKNFLSLW